MIEDFLEVTHQFFPEFVHWSYFFPTLNNVFQTNCLQLGQGALYYFLASPQIVFNSDKLFVQV